MADIIINEISRNYSWTVGNASYATVALPITASWGPAFMDPDTAGMSLEDMLERTSWTRFPATQEGMEAFIAAYRGPASNYRISKDYSYQMALTLLSAGYDVLVCRLCPGAIASGEIAIGSATLNIQAKYPGAFGNNLICKLKKVLNRDYWNLITYVKDTTTGVTTAVENLTFYFDLANEQANLLHISEVESKFLTFTVTGSVNDKTGTVADDKAKVQLSGGSDKADAADTDAATLIGEAKALATARFAAVGVKADDIKSYDYIKAYDAATTSVTDVNLAATHAYKEWVFRYAIEVYDLLKDRLTYNPNRIIAPGWDDLNITDIDGTIVERLNEVSPIHCKLMEVAYYSRCAVAYLDIPQCLPRKSVYNESTTEGQEGYAQMLARPEQTPHPNFAAISADDALNASLYPTHAALFAPWGQYVYQGTGKQAPASPAFQALMIERAMIKNQSLQYEWALPTNRKHNLNLGKLDYTVSKKLLDEWQKLEGVGVNVITNVPSMGTTLWGNSTLFEVPPATYQALANLSTRKLMNAVKDMSYRCGLSITFQYNNEQAYSAFYAGMTPLLDTMKNVGAIEKYTIEMSADISGLDRVNLNSVIGKITLWVHGVINEIHIDLIALPAGVDGLG